MGLPEDIWYPWSALFVNVSAADCSGTTCLLANACSSYSDILSEYSFQIMFTSDSSDYMRVPLEAFALDNVNGSCSIAVMKLASDLISHDNVVLGGLFFQEFVGVFNNTYDLVKATGQDVQLWINMYTNMSAAYIGDEMLAMGVDPFYTEPVPVVASDQTLIVSVNNETMTASVQAELGGQGFNKFMVSLTSSIVQAYSTNCSTVGIGQSSCSDSPNFAINYFDLSQGTALEAANVTLDGYTTNGDFYNQTICVQNQSLSSACTTQNQTFFVADLL